MDRRDKAFNLETAARSALSFDEMAQANRLAGRYWWEPDTLRFFRSRMVGGCALRGPDGRFYFCTSEKGPTGIRAYSVRVFNPETADVDTVGAFQGYASRSGAIGARDRIARAAKEPATT